MSRSPGGYIFAAQDALRWSRKVADNCAAGVGACHFKRLVQGRTDELLEVLVPLSDLHSPETATGSQPGGRSGEVSLSG